MRKLVFIVITTTLILITACESNLDESRSNIKYYTTILGGCNGQYFNDKSAPMDHSDTIVFSTTEDTLNVFVGINYICCAPFMTSAEIINDSLLMEITDTCSDPYHSCYCRCYCYYTFNFLFVNYQSTEFSFQVSLDDPREAKPEIIYSGEINPSANQ